MEKIHSLGQYFTTNIKLQEKVYEFIKNKPSIILEPSVGRGDLVNYIIKKEEIKFVMYEIDKTIEPLDSIKKTDIIYENFLDFDIKTKFKTIIGNPPYVKTKKGNLYLNFIEKCYNLLEKKGELIFIVPSMFLKMTSSSKLINKMLKDGTFTHIYHPNNEKLFKYASVDVIVFRYCKDNSLLNETIYNDKRKILNNTEGIITFNEDDGLKKDKISKYFKISVGMVSGKEEVFKNNKFGNVKILNKENVVDKYILIDKFPTKNKELNEYLLENKEKLIKRKIRKFSDSNWFEWGALRNIDKVITNLGKECIYVSNISRKDKIAFIGEVNYFGGGLLMLIPIENKINLEKVCDYLNSDEFKKNYTYSGRFKLGQRQLCNHLIDIIKIY